RRGAEDATGDAAPANPLAERQGHRRPGAQVECRPAWLDRILRSPLKVRPVPNLSPLQRAPDSLGHEEIQEAETASPAGRTLARRRRSSRASAFRPLAPSGRQANSWMMGAV